MHEVTIRRRSPSQNKTQYRHWRDYHAEKSAWLRLLRAALPTRIPEPRFVEIALLSYRIRLCDYANLVGGAKPIPDALILLGYLWDDSPRWFKASYEQHQVAKGDERTVIRFITP